MLFALLMYLPSAICLLILGAIVLTRQKNTEHILYFCLSVLLSAYMLTQLIALITDGDTALQVLRTGALLTNLVVFTLLLFVLRHTGLKVSRIVLFFAAIPLIFFTLIGYSPVLIQGINDKTSTGFSTQVGSLYNIQAIVLVLYLIVSVSVLVAGIKRASASSKASIRLLIVAFMVPIIANLLTNTLLLSVSAVQFLGPLSFVVFAAIVAYTMIKHRLFDIRAVIARSLGYAGSVAVIAAGYGFVVFGLANLFFDLRISIMAQVFLSAATGLAGYSFEYIRKAFDRATTRIFYQDAYDPQELFDQLNRLLVSSLDIKYLMQKSTGIIADNLRPDFCIVGLRSSDPNESTVRIYGTKVVSIPKSDLDKVRAVTPKIHRNVILTDDLDETKYHELKGVLRANNIAVLVRLTQSVRKTEEGLGYLALGGKKSGNPYGSQDIRTLEAVANELVLAIQNALHFEEIQRFNVALQERVDNATRKLRRTNEKLKALDETKDDFISMASHQLRTPLTSVKGYLSMVIEGDAGEINDTQKKMLGQAFISSQRMVYLIADLLNVSRLRTGKFIIDAAPTNLAEMVGEELDQLVETAAARDIKLTYNKPKSFPDVPLDETKTRQVIMNFVDNAIYYTPAGGHIKVDLQETPTSVELKVIDDGIGVPKTEQHHLFTKFYRAGNARKARPDGTGLGLYMAKKVVLAQGGSILFSSHEGKGSTFGFLFPKSSSHTAELLPVREKSAST